MVCRQDGVRGTIGTAAAALPSVRVVQQSLTNLHNAAHGITAMGRMQAQARAAAAMPPVPDDLTANGAALVNCPYRNRVTRKAHV